ncbi:hypothetical protein GQX74_015436 [Glossina fuscipes]|nr:hypothetical protein GQX74_015436 [Glossina fuscipes]
MRYECIDMQQSSNSKKFNASKNEGFEDLSDDELVSLTIGVTFDEKKSLKLLGAVNSFRLGSNSKQKRKSEQSSTLINMD